MVCVVPCSRRWRSVLTLYNHGTNLSIFRCRISPLIVVVVIIRVVRVVIGIALLVHWGLFLSWNELVNVLVSDISFNCCCGYHSGRVGCDWDSSVGLLEVIPVSLVPVILLWRSVWLTVGWWCYILWGLTILVASLVVVVRMLIFAPSSRLLQVRYLTLVIVIGKTNPVSGFMGLFHNIFSLQEIFHVLYCNHILNTDQILNNLLKVVSHDFVFS